MMTWSGRDSAKNNYRNGFCVGSVFTTRRWLHVVFRVVLLLSQNSKISLAQKWKSRRRHHRFWSLRVHSPNIVYKRPIFEHCKILKCRILDFPFFFKIKVSHHFSEQNKGSGNVPDPPETQKTLQAGFLDSTTLKIPRCVCLHQSKNKQSFLLWGYARKVRCGKFKR